VNVIILTHDVYAPGSMAAFGNPVNFVVVTTVEQVPGRLAPGTWRIVRRDRWQYDERVINALRQLAAFRDVEMIDPTGLLGGSRYGFDANRPDAPPIVQRSMRGRPPAAPKRDRRKLNTVPPTARGEW